MIEWSTRRSYVIVVVRTSIQSVDNDGFFTGVSYYRLLLSLNLKVPKTPGPSSNRSTKTETQRVSDGAQSVPTSVEYRVPPVLDESLSECTNNPLELRNGVLGEVSRHSTLPSTEESLSHVLHGFFLQCQQNIGVEASL